MNYNCLFVIFISILFLYFLNCKKNTFSNIKNDKHVLNKYFDSVNVISIPDRKEYMTKLMNDLDIKVNIIDATLIKNINYDNMIKNNFVSESYYKIKNQGRIACHYSQIKLIKKFLRSNDDTIFIFEDDLSDDLDDNYQNIIDRSMKTLIEYDKDWDIIFFGMCFENCRKMKKIKNNLYELYSPKCRHAYALSRKGAHKIIQYTIPMIGNGDEMYAKNIRNGNISAYGINPPIFYQNRAEFGSNLGNATKKRQNNLFFKLRKKINKDIKLYNNDMKTCV